MGDGPFQLFPALDGAVESALRSSIERFGVLVPVVRDQHGNTIDGHHRARIADEVGVKYRVDVVSVSNDDEAREIARTLNADRRHLSAEQRREVVADLREKAIRCAPLRLRWVLMTRQFGTTCQVRTCPHLPPQSDATARVTRHAGRWSLPPKTPKRPTARNRRWQPLATSEPDG